MDKKSHEQNHQITDALGKKFSKCEPEYETGRFYRVKLSDVGDDIDFDKRCKTLQKDTGMNIICRLMDSPNTIVVSSSKKDAKEILRAHFDVKSAENERTGQFC